MKIEHLINQMRRVLPPDVFVAVEEELTKYAEAVLAHKRETSERPYCCRPGCWKDAMFQVLGSSGHPEDYTEACEDHVGTLIGTPTWLPRENTHWTVYPLVTANA